MTLPNFFLAGVAKSGTTSLHNYLNQHPGIYMSPVKEPNYFSFVRDGAGDGPIDTLERYLELFEDVDEERAIGEASVRYFVSDNAPTRIRDTIPHAKLIFILRNPVDRAFSGYLMQMRHGKETDPPNKAFRRGKIFVEVGFYHEHLKRFYELFPAEQIAVYRFDDLHKDASALMADIYRFLEVDDQFVPDTGKVLNKGWKPRNAFIQVLRKHGVFKPVRNLPGLDFFRQLLEDPNTESMQLSAQVRKELIDLYAPDLEAVQKLTGVDVSDWLREFQNESVALAANGN